MEILNNLFNYIIKLFDLWFIVNPWEQAIRVRFGKKVKLLNAGIYFKIPYLDKIYINTVRKRMFDLSIQTITTKDEKTITLKCCAGYKIVDMYILYNSLFHPEITIGSMIMSKISEHIRTQDYKDINIDNLEEEIRKSLDFEKYGLGEISFNILSWSNVKTFRLIQDGSNMYEGLYMDELKTNNKL